MSRNAKFAPMKFEKIIPESTPSYLWGSNCEARLLVSDQNLSVKLENMPPHTAEQPHYHEKARQFFFIESGTADFEIDGINLQVNKGEGIWIEAGTVHFIENKNQDMLQFLVISQPDTTNDRININL